MTNTYTYEVTTYDMRKLLFSKTAHLTLINYPSNDQSFDTKPVVCGNGKNSLSFDSCT